MSEECKSSDDGSMHHAEHMLSELIQVFENDAFSHERNIQIDDNVESTSKELIEEKMVPVDSQIYDELSACCTDLETLQKLWIEKKDILMAGGCHFLCIILKNGDINVIKYIMENGGLIYLNRKSHLDRYPFDTMYDWNEIKRGSLEKDEKDKINYLIKMGSSMCWEAMWALYWYEKDILDFYIETLKSINDLRDEPKIKQRFPSMAMERATTNEAMEILMAKGIKPGSMDLLTAFMQNDNDRVAFFIKNVDLNEIDDDGNTILHNLCRDNDFVNSIRGLRLISFCLKNGADPTIINKVGESGLSLVAHFCEKEENEDGEMLKKVLIEMRSIVDINYVPDDRWKCIHCNHRNLKTNIFCKGCEAERIVDLTEFGKLLIIKEISSVLYSFIDCIALNSLIELDLLAINEYDALFSKEVRLDRYLTEMDDRLIKTAKTLHDTESLNVLDVRKVIMVVPEEININIDDILGELVEDQDLLRIIEEWKDTIDDIKPNEQNETNFKCICNAYLIKINDSSSLYNGNGAICNRCYKKTGVDEVFWHCNDEGNMAHFNGYDICNACINRKDDELPTNAYIEICKTKLLNKHSSNDFAEIYPLNKPFAMNDEECMKFITMCIALRNVDSIFSYDFRRIFGKKDAEIKWNYIEILKGFCKLLIKQDLLNEYQENKHIVPNNMTKMKHFYYNEELSERRSVSAHVTKLQNISNYRNEYKDKLNTRDPNECLSEMRFGELIINEYTEYNEQYEIDPNMLKDISQKILLEKFVSDVINEWYCLDLKMLQRDYNYDYENDTFSNYFYGLLSKKVGEGMMGDTKGILYEINFVESVVSYYYNYMS